MTTPITPEIIAPDPDAIAGAKGRVAVLIAGNGKLGRIGRRVNRLTRGGLARLAASGRFEKLKPGEGIELPFPHGMAAEALQVVKLDRRASSPRARKAGATIGRALGTGSVLVLVDSLRRADELVLGLMLRAYAFTDHKTKEAKAPGAVTVMARQPDELRERMAAISALAGGVFLTRDLVSEPANVLTTTEFAARLQELQGLGVRVEMLEEAALEKLGMRTLLGVGQGSESPSKVVVMKWTGSGDAAPIALVGKGVVFDTGGISLKPGAGMEEMTMDMAGAGVVAGVMHTVAARRARANVVGLVGLVENMPDGKAQRPGDIVRTMKGDTVEILNTDAEGRLVLADVLWYAQQEFKPAAMIDLATLTGAIIIGLGHEMAGVFSNDDRLCADFLKAAATEGEGAWRMPLAPAYDKLLKSDLADMKNIGGRSAGSVTAAQFLQRFVKKGCPWVHLDIAGVARVRSATELAPKGATGWGVLALNRLIAERFEG